MLTNEQMIEDKDLNATVVVDSLKALDPKRPIREATKSIRRTG
jgi:hypothetical protein